LREASEFSILACMFTPTSIQQLEQWITVPTEYEGLEFKAARSQFSGERVMDYCVGIGNDGGGRLIWGVTNNPPRQGLLY